MALDYKSSLTRYRRYLQLVRNQPLWNASMWVIMSLILLIVLLVLALKPTLVTISGLLGQIKQQKEISIKLNEKIGLVQQAIIELDSVKSKVPLLDEALPKTASWNTLADSLQKIATDSGLMLVDLSIDKIPLTPNEILSTSSIKYIPQVPNGVMPVRFTLTLTGDYTQMRKVISGLEKMARVVMITHIEISTDKNGNQVMNLSGEAGYLPDQYL